MGKQVEEFLIESFYRYHEVTDKGITKIGRALKTLNSLKKVKFEFKSQK